MTLLAEFDPPEPFEILQNLVSIILQSSLRKRPLVCEGLDEALEAASYLNFPTMKDWFRHELTTITEGKLNDNGTPRWGDLIAYKLVKAAVKQLGAEHPYDRELWERLIFDRKYTTLALIALSSLDTNVAHGMAQRLEIWWKANPDSRKHCLSQIIEIMIKKIPEEEKLLNMLRHKGAVWSQQLRMAVNHELRIRGLALPFPPTTSTT